MELFNKLYSSAINVTFNVHETETEVQLETANIRPFDKVLYNFFLSQKDKQRKTNYFTFAHSMKIFECLMETCLIRISVVSQESH